MEPISAFIVTASGYILNGILQSKAVDNVKEELLGKFWNWIKPKFLKVAPKLEENPESPENVKKVQEKLIELVKDEDFYIELVKKVDELKKAGIKEKNIVKGDIINVEEIRIGDKTYNPNEPYTRKNIVEGNVKDAKTFRLGDGD